MSDEPTRLRDTVVPIFGDETLGWSAALPNGASSKLVAGVLAQDDCAIFSLQGCQDLVLGSDYVRGSKFTLYELGYLSNFDVGYYLAMANLSDIAAMGAVPIALLTVIRYPVAMSDKDFGNVVKGVRAACDHVGVRNVGGDIGTAERLILSGSAVGVVEPGRALRRNGAKAGDILCVTGRTGMAGAALQYFRSLDDYEGRLSRSSEHRLLNAWRRPDPLIRQGRILCSSGAATSCQDSSDGLKATIESLAAASDVGFTVDEARVPVAPLVANVAELRGRNILDLIFGDSVDFQLVFTVAPQYLRELKGAFRTHDLSLFEIGTATESNDVIMRTANGAAKPLPGEGWRHNT
jgi:thiamine-monophosphate kinase